MGFANVPGQGVPQMIGSRQPRRNGVIVENEIFALDEVK
jgi:hypothetical protein